MLAQTIAHYRVQGKIGAGGMGEVYRATDIRLGRDVAIKVLPEALARDAECMGRFEREAKVLASLNHPNIASIYGLEESNGVRALIMELVEGPTLAARINQGPFPLDEALSIAKQIAEGLEYAHERGIIHRDLKPSNVKLTADGQVKVLDFGLAKALEGESTEEELQNSPTLSAVATRAGVLLGTAAYMSPEQARGKRLDRRADIWSFGCVLYEMLTGHNPFDGETTSDILACVIRAEPDWPAVPSSVPARIRELLRSCLQKDPRHRLQAIGDARITLEEVLSGTPEEAGARQTAAGPVWLRALPWAAGIVLATIVGVAAWELRPRPEPPVVQFSFGPPAGDTLAVLLGGTSLGISTDGTSVAFIGRHSGISQLYVRRLDRLDTIPLKGTDNAFYPFFSPDGQWIAFFSAGKLKKVPALGGTPVTLCDAPASRGGTWSPDNTIIFASANSGLMRVPAAGGTPEPLTRLDSSRGERSHRWPQVLPGGKAVLFNRGDFVGNTLINPAISLVALKTGEVRTLPVQGSNVRYLPGYLAFTRGEALFAAPFNLQRLEVTGSPFPAGEVMITPSGTAFFAVSETGSLAYVPAGAGIGTLAWVDAKGVAAMPGLPARDYFSRLQLSPDGKRVVLVILEGVFRHIWVYDTVRGSLTRLTFGDSDNVSPTWSPDGRRMAFVSSKDGNSVILTKPADGSGREETLLSAKGSPSFVSSWSPDGRFLAYMQPAQTGNWGTWVLTFEGQPKPQPFWTNDQFDQIFAVFSPDSKYLAYVSNESGRYEVYVRPFGQGGGKWQISTGGGNFPVWARSGRQLFYRESGNIMGVDVTTQPVFSLSTPRVIVPAAVTAPLSNGLDNFDVSPDGQRFLVHQQNSEASQSLQINVILNWSEELRRLNPSGKN